MSQIARLHTVEIVDGNIVEADDLNDEFDQLVSESNAQDLRITGIETLTDEANTWPETQTFSAAVDPIKTDIVSERTPAAGVTIDSVRLKDGMVKVAGTPATAGEIGYASNLLTFYNGTTVKTIATIDTVSVFSKGYMSIIPPIWQSASTVRIPSGFSCRNDANTADITVGSNIDVALSASGAAGLDTGSEASGTWYYLWVCSGGSGTTGIFSTSQTSPTLPSGYADNKRLLPGAWRNDASSNIINQYFKNFNAKGTEVIYYVYMAPYSASPGPTNVLDGGTQTSFTDVNLASYVPPQSKLASVKFDSFGNSHTLSLRPNGYTADDFYSVNTSSTNGTVSVNVPIPTDSSQVIEYKTSGSTVDGAVFGYTCTEYSNGL